MVTFSRRAFVDRKASSAAPRRHRPDRWERSTVGGSLSAWRTALSIPGPSPARPLTNAVTPRSRAAPGSTRSLVQVLDLHDAPRGEDQPGSAEQHGVDGRLVQVADLEVAQAQQVADPRGGEDQPADLGRAERDGVARQAARDSRGSTVVVDPAVERADQVLPAARRVVASRGPAAPPAAGWGIRSVDRRQGEPEVVLVGLVEVDVAGDLDGPDRARSGPRVGAADEDVGRVRVVALVRRRLGVEEIRRVAQPPVQLVGQRGDGRNRVGKSPARPGYRLVIVSHVQRHLPRERVDRRDRPRPVRS